MDPFCGSGMTGVAALKAHQIPLLIELSPAATFIAFNYLVPVDAREYVGAVEETLAATYDEQMKLYATHCQTCGKLVAMEYVVWGSGLICEFCHQEFVLWDVARHERHNETRRRSSRRLTYNLLPIIL
jgi:hypothetical protein